MQRFEDGQWVEITEEQLNDGDLYRIPVGNGGWQQQTYKPLSVYNVYSVSNVTTKINGNAPESFSPIYFVNDGDSITISADIVDSNGVKQTQLDQTGLGYPPILALPATKYAGGVNGTPIDEIYFRTTLVSGTMSAQATLSSPGNWKLTTERLNASLESIGADWGIDSINVDFIVS